MGISQFSQFSAVLRALSLVHSNMGFCILDTLAALVAACLFPGDAETIDVHNGHIDSLQVVSLSYQEYMTTKYRLSRTWTKQGEIGLSPFPTNMLLERIY